MPLSLDPRGPRNSLYFCHNLRQLFGNVNSVRVMASGKIIYCSAREIGKMRRAGLVVWLAHQRMATLVAPGVTTQQLNEAVRETFRQFDAEPLFLNYPPDAENPFPAETCISVNDQIVHGIPDNRKLRVGDVVSVDTGCRINGWCGDAAVTHAVGSVEPEVAQLLTVTRETLDIAFQQMASAGTWSQVAKAMDDHVSQHGYGIVEELVGHGIGRNLHQPPDVPNYYSSEWAERSDFKLRTGMVLAVEPMINLGTKRTRLARDGWTIVTADRKPSAHFEHTIGMTSEGPKRLTGPPEPEELASLGPVDWLPEPDDWYRW